MMLLIALAILGFLIYVLFRIITSGDKGYKGNTDVVKPIIVEPIKILKNSTEDYIDDNGYKRNSSGRLIHREIAFLSIYSYPYYPKRFREYQVHHKDLNKLNNSVDNLQIVTREEHKKIHGIK